MITLSDLDQFTGTDNIYYHTSTVVYTDGIKFLADNTGCYWLINKITILQKYILGLKYNSFQVWNIVVNPSNTAVIKVTDGNDVLLYKECIEYTDFPFTNFNIWFVRGTILLPSEY